MTCLPMTSSPNGGNCTIRGATRRRHAEGRLLMLQNPPSSPGCGGVAEVNCVPESPASQNIWAISPTTPRCRRLLPRWFATWPPHTREPRPHRHQAGGVALHGDPCVTCLSMTSPSNGGNCTIRGATRRRHADRTLLMVQNPHHYPWCHAPSLVQDCPTGATPPRGATSPTVNGGSCATRGPLRDLPASDIATKRGELHH